MKIGIDGLALERRPSGIGKYLLSIVEFLTERLPQAEFVIYSNREVFIPDSLKNIKIVIDRSISGRLKPLVWLKTFSTCYINKDGLDFYIGGLGFLPQLPRTIKSIVIVHDLNYKIVPETMGLTHYLAHRFFLKNDVLKSDFVICNSEGTASKVKNFFGREATVVVNPPIDKMFKQINGELVREKLRELDIESEYLLTVGTQEPRKNLLQTVKVFVSLLEKGLVNDYKLVLVGNKGWKNKDLYSLISRYPNHIKQLGYVEDEYLPFLYNGAKIFLFPSKYEGFGMPVREALSCGTAVITTDIEELREAGGSSAVYIDPMDTVQYEKKLLEIINGAVEHEPLRSNIEPLEKLLRLFQFIEH